MHRVRNSSYRLPPHQERALNAVTQPYLTSARAACSARPSRRKAKAMRVPSILQGEALTQILQGMVTGAVAMLVFLLGRLDHQ
jgi:hypothetical protein